MTNNLPKVTIPQKHTFCKVAMILVFSGLLSCRQSTHSALEVTPDHISSATLGVNLGYYPPFWTEKTQALEARKFGCVTLRTGLFHYVLEQWGYEQKAETLRICKQLGYDNMVGILGYPASDASDTLAYCSSDSLPQVVFKGVYLPIWKQNVAECVVNEENSYALYIWKVATHYRGLIRIYEVWNEPDAGSGGALKGNPGNWWDMSPPPCQTGFKASIFHYIRLLRITYEVVKKVDPEALVAVGGLGWPAYLDAICRYTDQPENGLKNHSEYPLTGGAYFDCMSFHAYPHLFALGNPMSEVSEKSLNRHSDAATAGLWQRKKALEEVLANHGFDGVKYPQKHWICSEFNLPRRSVRDRFGSEPAQINFVLKALISAHWNGMSQMHLYSFADEVQEPSADPEFAFMGLVLPPDSLTPEKIMPNQLAISMQNLAKCMLGYTFDPVLTKQLRLPAAVDGGVFSHQTDSVMIVLWLKTTLDLKENQAAPFTLPVEWETRFCQMYSFESNIWSTLDPKTQEITLTNTPIILKTCTNWR